ncbi:MAG: nucleotidyltransferase domain-containing protein [Candidatus Dormibacteria bacterium]
MTGREIARLSEKSEHGTRETLRRLVKHGLVRREDLSVGAFYRLNREHLALEVVLELLELRQKLIQRVRAEIARWDIAPTNASIFGSSARGDGGIESDIDLLIVRPRNVSADAQKWRDQVADLRDRVLSWTGNECNVLEIAESSVSSLVRDRPELAHGLARDGVLVAGTPLKQPTLSNREVGGRLGTPFPLRSSQLEARELVS